MKAEDFPHHVPSLFGFPPGFVALKSKERLDRSPFGVLPDEKGNSRWVQVEKGSEGDGIPNTWNDLREGDRKATQRLWLRHLRLVEFESAGRIEAEIGISRRTWQGWEGGKAIPYFQAARLSFMQWEKRRADHLETSRAYRHRADR